jgi:hypothetical protein
VKELNFRVFEAGKEEEVVSASCRNEAIFKAISSGRKPELVAVNRAIDIDGPKDSEEVDFEVCAKRLKNIILIHPVSEEEAGPNQGFALSPSSRIWWRWKCGCGTSVEKESFCYTRCDLHKNGPKDWPDEGWRWGSGMALFVNHFLARGKIKKYSTWKKGKFRTAHSEISLPD